MDNKKKDGSELLAERASSRAKLDDMAGGLHALLFRYDRLVTSVFEFGWLSPEDGVTMAAVRTQIRAAETRFDAAIREAMGKPADDPNQLLLFERK